MCRMISWMPLAGLLALPAYAQHEHPEQDLEELVVSAARAQLKADTMMSINVLTEEALRENAARTLGETLNKQAGVTFASFGPAVGQPVIRGQSGNRVQILQDGVGTMDAALLSQDHANVIEPLLAERIEVVRGPSTLLYGSGAIGGVVNVVDNRIPERVPEAFGGAVELRADSVADGRAGVFKLDGGQNSFAWHLDGVARQTDNVRIPGLAVDEALSHDDDAEGEVVTSTDGFIANSATEASSTSAGTSWIGERGFWGMSLSVLNNEYGLPPGAHGHGHDEEPLAESPEQENVRIDMEQTRIDLKGATELEGFIKQLRIRIGVNDYEHRELEGDEIGTVFNNEGAETRILFDHGDDRFGGVWGAQVVDRQFGAVGEESFIPTADIRANGLFAVESWNRKDWSYELGLRFDRQSIDPQSGGCHRSVSSHSGSASAIWRFRDDSNLLIAFNRAERAPTVEELFSNIEQDRCMPPVDAENLILHSATARLEIGEPNLNNEVSQNLEVALRKHAGDLRAEVNLFYNQIADYIYLSDQGEFEEQTVSRYMQQDANFAGAEVQLSMPFEISKRGHVDLSLFGDLVRAEFDAGGHVPRIPPKRGGVELAYAGKDWIIKLRTSVVSRQDRVAANEVPTAGYTRVDLYVDYHLQGSQGAWLLFIKGNNLTDATIRNHVSLLKHFAPEAGRGIEVGARYTF